MDAWRKPSAVSQGRNGQSALGIASLAIAIVSILVRFIMLLFIGLSAPSMPLMPLRMEGNEEIILWMLALSIFGSIFLDFLSIGIGVGGILQKTNVRICAFIGIALSTSSLVIIAGSIFAFVSSFG